MVLADDTALGAQSLEAGLGWRPQCLDHAKGHLTREGHMTRRSGIECLGFLQMNSWSSLEEGWLQLATFELG